MTVRDEFTQRITFVNASLTGGGAERVMCLMANDWVARGCQVTIIKLDAEKYRPSYALDPQVTLRSADFMAIRGRSNPLTAWLKCLQALRRMVFDSRPDIVIAFMIGPNVHTILATLGGRVPLIVMEHNDPRTQPIKPVWAFLRWLTYPIAARVALLHDDHLAFFGNRVRRKAIVMPIPIAFDSEQVKQLRATVVPRSGKKAIAMGRLNQQKGFDILIRAFAGVALEHPDWSLDIWGEGELRDELERLTVSLGLQERVRLPGRTDRPLETMCGSDLFVLSSRYEGMPAVLFEAMAAGMPVIAFNCPTGPASMIQHGVDGLLVAREDESALAAAMDHLMRDSEERRRLGAHALEIQTRFSLPGVMAVWDALVLDVLRNGAPELRRARRLPRPLGGAEGRREANWREHQ